MLANDTCFENLCLQIVCLFHILSVILDTIIYIIFVLPLTKLPKMFNASGNTEDSKITNNGWSSKLTQTQKISKHVKNQQISYEKLQVVFTET